MTKARNLLPHSARFVDGLLFFISDNKLVLEKNAGINTLTAFDIIVGNVQFTHKYDNRVICEVHKFENGELESNEFEFLFIFMAF